MRQAATASSPAAQSRARRQNWQDSRNEDTARVQQAGAAQPHKVRRRNETLRLLGERPRRHVEHQLHLTVRTYDGNVGLALTHSAPPHPMSEPPSTLVSRQLSSAVIFSPPLISPSPVRIARPDRRCAHTRQGECAGNAGVQLARCRGDPQEATDASPLGACLWLQCAHVQRRWVRIQGAGGRGQGRGRRVGCRRAVSAGRSAPMCSGERPP